MRWLAVAVALCLGSPAWGDIVRPEIELITAVKLGTDATSFAEQLIERARQQMIESYQANDEAHRARYNRDPARRARAEERERRLAQYANAHLDLAIALLERRDPVTVRSLVLVGYAHQLARREALADDAARALVELCWRCPEAADAHLRLADHALAAATDVDSLAPAIEHFGAAAANDAASPEVRAYAEYKLAWCLYNLDDRSAALAHLRWSLGLAVAAGNKGDRLARQVRKDVATLMANRPLSNDF